MNGGSDVASILNAAGLGGGGLGGLGGGGNWWDKLLSHVRAGVSYGTGGNAAAMTFNGPDHQMDALIKQLALGRMGGGGSTPTTGVVAGTKNPETNTQTRPDVPTMPPINVSGFMGGSMMGDLVRRNPYLYQPGALTSRPS